MQCLEAWPWRTHLKSFLKNLKINRSVFFKSCMTARVNLIEKMNDGHSICISLGGGGGGGGRGGTTNQGHLYTLLLFYRTQILVLKENNTLFFIKTNL